MRARIKTLILLGLVVFDQTLKYLVLSSTQWGSINKDLAFSIGFSYPLLLNLIALFLLVSLIYLLDKKKISSFPVVLITSGALSNIVDRVYRGGVVDFIDLGFWPTFNSADIYIASGAIWLLIVLLKEN